jgi:tetratricopeptide (TPR) repeat protein
MDDFAADTKAPKRVARTMMLMTRDVNSKLGAELGKPAGQLTQVGCVTCHRGVAIPKQLVDIVTETATAKNATAALDQYRELRKQYHGAAAYDFSDFTLFSAAQRAIAAMRPDDALAYLNANVEFHPNSARSYQQMSVAYQRKMDTPNAIKMLEKAVELDPMNMGFRNQLNQLKNPAPAAQ